MALTQEQIDNFFRATTNERYTLFIGHAQAQQTVWTLADEQGCVLLQTGKETCLPVWPYEELAASWCSGEYAHCKPMQVALNIWLEKWLPGMANDNYDVAVLPNLAGDSVVVSAAELAQEMLD